MRISDWSSDVCSSDLALERCALDLLDHGADPFASSASGDPPLALAVRLGWMRLLERLVDCGVDLDARDGHGMTALHLCAALSREAARSEEHTSELQSLMRISYAVFCLKKKQTTTTTVVLS